MNNTFLTEIIIEKVRHLCNVIIPLSETERKHLIITGKNGSGKTSLLEALKNNISKHATPVFNVYKQDDYYKMSSDLNIKYTSLDDFCKKYKSGLFVLAYYPAERQYQVQISNHIEKISLKETYAIEDHPHVEFVKYLADLKTREAMYEKANKSDLADKITEWFVNFENLLCRIFDDTNLKLDFDIETFEFKILMSNREPFSFNELSAGYAAVINIITDIIMRMEKNASHFYSTEGIVIIDEIETHLHLELQKTILPMLTEIFPNIQFIVSTHSPFIISSLNNAVLYDLEKNLLVKSSLDTYSYESVVEGYFNVDEFSETLRNKFDRYKEIISKDELSSEDWVEIAEIEQLYLDKIPDYLDVDFNAEYNNLKLELENRS